MGMTDELAIGHFYKRLTLCESLFGDGEWNLRRLGAAAAASAIAFAGDLPILEPH